MLLLHKDIFPIQYGYALEYQVKMSKINIWYRGIDLQVILQSEKIIMQSILWNATAYSKSPTKLRH